MQLIQTKVYSTKKTFHVDYVLDSQSQSKSPEENFRAMVEYLFSKGVKYFKMFYHLGYDQCDWDSDHLSDMITPETTEEEWQSLLPGIMGNLPNVCTQLNEHCLAIVGCRTGNLHCSSRIPHEDALHVCECFNRRG